MVAASSAVVFLVLASEPAAHSKADLEALLRVAEAETVPFFGHCGSEGGSEPAAVMPTIDREAEAGFARVAEIRNLFVRTYPYAKLGRQADKWHNDDVNIAVQQYELAFACNPGWEQRRYLDAALEMVLARRVQLKDGGLAEPPELTEAERRLRARLAGLQPPGACPPERPCIPLGPVPPPAETRLGRYRARAMEILSLRVELGAGFLARWYDGTIRVDRPPIITSVAPGVRFLAGKKRRHVFGAGFRYNLLAYVGGSGGAHQLMARLEYGVRAHPKWFSIHAGFEPGIQIHPKEPNFGHSQIGAFGSLCTWNEALCLRLGGSVAVVPFVVERSLDLGYVTFGVDLFRVVENRLTGPGTAP